MVYNAHMSLAENKRARFDYELLDKLEGGLVLEGREVKSIKGGHVQLKGSFLMIRNGELWLKNAHVSAYGPAGNRLYDPTRDRKVLIHKRELRRLIGKVQQEGMTLVPLAIYSKTGLVKLEFALARGKKKYEKREAIKKREVARTIKEHLRM